MEELRPDLKIVRQVLEGETSYLVRDPVSHKYFRFRPVEYAVLTKLDGTHEFDEAARLAAAETGARLSGGTVERFAASLKKLNLIAQTTGEKSIALLERLRRERKLRVSRQAAGGSLFYIRFPAVDPDAAYNRVLPHIRFLWSRGFCLFSLAFLALASTILIADWDTVKAGTARLYSQGGGHVLLAYLVLSTVIVIHENAHGLTCKYYGGEVHEMGFMLIYFLPAFYANVTDATTFESKAAKLWVTAAGSYAELVILSAATLVWYFSSPEHFFHELAFLFILVAGISSIPINMNPLIKLDGYFALADWLGVPNLHDRSSDYIAALARKHVFRLPAEIPSYPDRVRRILIVYGAASLLYRVIFLLVVLRLFDARLTRVFPQAGGLILAALVVTLFRRKLRAAWSSVRYFWLDKREKLMQAKWLAASGALAVAALGAFLFAPAPYFRTAPFVIQPLEYALVRAGTEGFVARVAVREGSRVERGETLAVLRNAELETRAAALRLEMEELGRAEQQALGKENVAAALAERRRREQIGAVLEETKARLGRLRLTAPADGIVVTPGLENREGAELKAGEIFCRIVPAGSLVARVYVEEEALEDVGPGARARLRLDAGGREITGYVTRVAPASELHHQLAAPGGPTPTGNPSEGGLPEQRWEPPRPRYVVYGGTSFAAPVTKYEAVVEVPTQAEYWKAGMSGLVKIYGKPRSLGYSVWKAARDSLRSRIWW